MSTKSRKIIELIGLSKEYFIKSINSAQSLFEVIFAVGISAVIITAIVSLTTTSVANSTTSTNSKLTVQYSQEALSFIRLTRDQDWPIFESYAATDPGVNYCMDDLNFDDTDVFNCKPIANTGLTRTVNLTKNSVAANFIDVTVYMSWEDSKGVHQDKTVTRLANWEADPFINEAFGTPIPTFTPFPTGIPICVPPPVPALGQPINGSFIDCSGPTIFTWSASSGADSYKLRIDNTTDNGWAICPSVFVGDYCINGITITERTQQLIPGKSYSYWIYAHESSNGGCDSLSSSKRIFACLSGPTNTPTPTPTFACYDQTTCEFLCVGPCTTSGCVTPNTYRCTGPGS